MQLRCPGGKHVGPIQQFTECCMACGRNIYETDEEYEKELSKELEQETKPDRIAEKEAMLAARQKKSE